jgi:hypothetical protein
MVTIPLRSQICVALWVNAHALDVFFSFSLSFSLSLSLKIGLGHLLCARFEEYSTQGIDSLPLKNLLWTWKYR